MKKYQVFAISRTYYSITIDAESKEEALLKIENKKNLKFNIERIDPIEVLENSVQQINTNEKSDNI
jgi:hypothetical protein